MLKKSYWLFGLSAGLLGALVQHAYFHQHWYSVPKTKAFILTLQFGILTIAIIAFAWTNYKQSPTRGKIIFSGLLIACIKSMFMLLTYSFIYFQSPEIIEEIKEDTLVQLKNLSEIKEEKFDKINAMKRLEINSRPANWGVAKLILHLFSGLFASIFVGLFFGKSNIK